MDTNPTVQGILHLENLLEFVPWLAGSAARPKGGK